MVSIWLIRILCHFTCNTMEYQYKALRKLSIYLILKDMDNVATIPVDKNKIKQAVQMNIPISINTYTLPKETETYIVDVAKVFLGTVHQDGIQDYIVYCLNELTTNYRRLCGEAVFKNIKEKGFDIYDQKSYDEGMLNFKQESLSNIDYYLQQQKKEGLYIKVIMQVKQGQIIFEVRNNVQMVATEFKRIFDRMVVARDYENVDQAFMQCIEADIAGELMAEEVGIAVEISASEKADVT